MSFLRNHWKLAVPAGAALAAFGAWLIFGFFGFHTLFIDDEVNESGPVFASGAGASGLPSDEISEALAADMNDFAESTDMPETVAADEAMPDELPEIVVLASGEFSARSHPGSGIAEILNDGSAQRFLRFENFRTDNGPDLNVYLSAAPGDAPASEFDDDFIDLGDLKGNVGSQNYEIPEDVDLERYSTVVVWCVRFGVAFTVAELSA